MPTQGTCGKEEHTVELGTFRNVTWSKTGSCREGWEGEESDAVGRAQHGWIDPVPKVKTLANHAQQPPEENTGYRCPSS